MVMMVKMEKEKLKTCLTCPICNDFFDRATTISECLHTFCRKCIHDIVIEKDLDACPVCNAYLGCAPLEKLRPDHSLQDLRLKLFPANGGNSMAETETSAAPSSTSRRKEKSLSSLIASSPRVSSPRSNADTTVLSKLDHEKDHVDLVSDLLIVEKPGEKAEDVPQVKISSRGLPKYHAGRRKSRLSPEQDDVKLDSDMLIVEETGNKVENDPMIPSASEMPPNIAQEHRSNHDGVPSEGDLQKEHAIEENEGFAFNLWKPLSCLAEAAERTKFGKGNQNSTVSKSLSFRQDNEHIEKYKELENGKSMRDDVPDQVIEEAVVQSNGQEDGKSTPISCSDIAKTSVIKAKDSSNEKGCYPPPLRLRRKLLGVRQKNGNVPEVQGTLQEATAMEVNNKAEGRNIPVWFSLVASENQGTEAPLPQISSCYLRVKDANLTVSFIKKYLVKKLSLASEVEVEISLRGVPLHSTQRLHSLLDLWVQTAQVSERISSFVGGSAKDFVMVLSYSRKCLL